VELKIITKNHTSFLRQVHYFGCAVTRKIEARQCTLRGKHSPFPVTETGKSSEGKVHTEQFSERNPLFELGMLHNPAKISKWRKWLYLYGYAGRIRCIRYHVFVRLSLSYDDETFSKYRDEKLSILSALQFLCEAKVEFIKRSHYMCIRNFML
jgi:hypothetical protein